MFAAAQLPTPATAGGGGLLDFDPLNMGGGSAAAVPQHSAPRLVLRSNANCTPQLFQAQWGQLAANGQIAQQFDVQQVSQIESTLQASSLKTVASGKRGSTMTLYMYGQEDSSGEYIFIEILADTAGGKFTASIKSPDAAKSEALASLVKAALSGMMR